MSDDMTHAEAMRLHTPDLTPAQSRYLREIQEAGQRSYNGRARKPLEALRIVGLIEYDFDLVSSGAYGQMTERFTCRPLNPAREKDIWRAELEDRKARLHAR